MKKQSEALVTEQSILADIRPKLETLEKQAEDALKKAEAKLKQASETQGQAERQNKLSAEKLAVIQSKETEIASQWSHIASEKEASERVKKEADNLLKKVQAANETASGERTRLATLEADWKKKIEFVEMENRRLELMKRKIDVLIEDKKIRKELEAIQ